MTQSIAQSKFEQFTGVGDEDGVVDGDEDDGADCVGEVDGAFDAGVGPDVNGGGMVSFAAQHVCAQYKPSSLGHRISSKKETTSQI